MQFSRLMLRAGGWAAVAVLAIFVVGIGQAQEPKAKGKDKAKVKAKAKAERPSFPAYLSAAEAGDDFAVQGEYAGEVAVGDKQVKLGLQVVALGDGKFDAVLYEGGLPGAGWKRGDTMHAFSSFTPKNTPKNAAAAKAIRFRGAKGQEYRLSINPARHVAIVRHTAGEAASRLAKTDRKSETLGMKPPAGAIVLFDGTSADAFSGIAAVEDGLLAVDSESHQGALTKDEFGDFALHLEFATPFMPTATGQARGNSGVYVQNRYEVQVLDSFGLEGLDNECGGIYQQAEPAVNMCLPPLAWQTYDMDFTAPRFDADGKKTSNARITLKHNGVTIYDDLELEHVTPGGAATEGPRGPIKLQDHRNPVRYRNIWIAAKN